MSFKSGYGTLENAEGSWLEFVILTLIWIGSLVFDTPKFKILGLYLDFESAKTTHVLQVSIWGFGGCWSFLTGVWHLDHDLDMITGLWYTHDPSFGSLSRFWKCKGYPCHFESLFGTLEDAGGSWLGYGILILILILLLVFDIPLIHVSALYLYSEDAKNIYAN